MSADVYFALVIGTPIIYAIGLYLGKSLVCEHIWDTYQGEPFTCYKCGRGYK